MTSQRLRIENLDNLQEVTPEEFSSIQGGLSIAIDYKEVSDKDIPKKEIPVIDICYPLPLPPRCYPLPKPLPKPYPKPLPRPCWDWRPCCPIVL